MTRGARLAAALLAAGSARAAAEQLTVTTYYPAPSGVYSQMLTTQDAYLARDGGKVMVGTSTGTQKLTVLGGVAAAGVDFASHEGLAPLGAPALLPGETVPAPGRVFYNRDADQFYYATRGAVAADRKTWYKPLGAGITLAVAADGTLSDTLPASKDWLAPWTAVTGASACSGACLRSEPQSSGGLYVAVLEGTYCTSAGNPTGSPVLILRYRRTGGNWVTLASSDDEIDVSGSPNCGAFELTGMFIARGNVTLDVGLKGKRDNSGDTVSAQVRLSRILSF